MDKWMIGRRLATAGFALAGLGIMLHPSPARAKTTSTPATCPAHAVAHAKSMSDATRALMCLDRSHDLIVVGDIHGTRQIPAFVGSLVERASRRRPVRLGLEMPSFMRATVANYLQSHGTAADRAALLKGVFWNMQDGRESRAMLGLIDRVRELRAKGRDVGIFMMVPNLADPSILKKPGGFMVFKEDGMARAIRAQQAAAGVKALVIAYMGNWHSRYDPKKSGSTLEQLANLHPVLVVPEGYGSAWVCMVKCGVHTIGNPHLPMNHGPRMKIIPDPSGRVFEVHLRFPEFVASLPAKKPAKS